MCREHRGEIGGACGLAASLQVQRKTLAEGNKVEREEGT